MGGCPKLEVSKQGHKIFFENHEITGKDSTCSKQLKLIENKRFKPNYWSLNKFHLVQTWTSDNYFSQFSSDCHADSSGTQNVWSMHAQNFHKLTNHGCRKDALEITLCLSSWYSLGRLQKKIIGTQICM